MPTSARRFDNRAVGFGQPVPPVRVRGDVGIAPYAKGGILPFIKARFFWGAGGPSSGPGYEAYSGIRPVSSASAAWPEKRSYCWFQCV